MHYHNPQEIKDYLGQFSGNHRILGPLLESALFDLIQKDFRFSKLITNEDEIDDYSAQKAFRKTNRFRTGIRKPIETDHNEVQIKNDDSTPPRINGHDTTPLWVKFAPTDELDDICDKITHYLTRFHLHVAPKDFNGMVPIAACQKLESYPSIDALMRDVENERYPLNDQEIDQAKSTRLKTYEEERNLAKHIGDLSDRCFLLQITTVQGMKIAGKKADNCLGWKRLPDSSEPHKQRVLKPDQWLYFSVRDPDNNSIATICVDVKKGKIQYEGNDSKPASERHHHLIDEAYDMIDGQFPHIRKNQISRYGARPRIG